MLGLCFCARAFSSCGKRGPLFIAVHGPLTIAASLVVELRLQLRRLSSCGSRVQLLHGMWESSQTSARTRVPRTGRQILNHCATREARICYFLFWVLVPQVCPVCENSLSCTPEISAFFRIYAFLKKGKSTFCILLNSFS